ncbi:hypothetical protein Y1Q_0012871 [Alligator mississippiensis]|uniref:Uncharacterized protein n=1 Tax=Alligator mississippiensis TaxID=8496 RepID=A0A151P4G5_ALLMI|nr:hypothetical protein Y1Q_0012871 [Alligator mississippiensis]
MYDVEDPRFLQCTIPAKWTTLELEIPGFQPPPREAGAWKDSTGLPLLSHRSRQLHFWKETVFWEWYIL